MDFLKNHYWKRWIKNHGCKFAGGLPCLGRRTELVLEEEAKLGHVNISAAQLTIGAHTYIRSQSHLWHVSSIGRFCSIGADVIIGQEKHTHPTHWVSSHPFQFTDSPLLYEPKIEMATIGHDVWIGQNAVVMEGVTVGTGAVIATRAVVTKDVQPYAIVAGIPAKVVAYRHPPEVVDRLLASHWWDKGVSDLQRLSLNEPLRCMDELDRDQAMGVAHYRKLRITRRGCNLLH
ncbi:CatB-related O-acetyltransferase [Pseudomonas gingeri]|uniref:CatB-related O-acetyltransferase n=1 Tax=Pseudomonas gingeri TaxID=117681 RepID=UPI0015C07FD8|nr:CatB-related O-acetyltransferase [Pseudomonas gingeri]NWD47788.1 CatB-related O-acetyltransferase [Pseudomonas gingeri]